MPLKNKPGYSWGIDAPINLMRSSKGWLAVFYNIIPPQIIKIFRPKNTVDYLMMFRQLALWNYGTCDLCPMVKIDMDYTS